MAVTHVPGEALPVPRLEAELIDEFGDRILNVSRRADRSVGADGPRTTVLSVTTGLDHPSRVGSSELSTREFATRLKSFVDANHGTISADDYEVLGPDDHVVRVAIDVVASTDLTGRGVGPE